MICYELFAEKRLGDLQAKVGDFLKTHVAEIITSNLAVCDHVAYYSLTYKIRK